MNRESEIKKEASNYFEQPLYQAGFIAGALWADETNKKAKAWDKQLKYFKRHPEVEKLIISKFNDLLC